MEESMIEILLFGSAREAVGKSSMSVSSAPFSNVAQFRVWMQSQYPKLTALHTCAIAVNETFARDDESIQSGDTLAIIPPVSGG